jgi:hypothetical protein
MVWPWVVDSYVGALFLLSCSGLLMISIKIGLLTRGLVLTGAGIILPVLFLLLYY